MEKVCTACKVPKPLDQFFNNPLSADGLAYRCKRCVSDSAAASVTRMRLKVLAVLGGRCVRCDFDDQRALTIDHIAGGGCAHRKQEYGTGYGYYKRMLEDLTPYQALCWNCQHIKRIEEKEHRSAGSIL